MHHESSIEATPGQLQELLRKQNQKCGVSGLDLTPESATVVLREPEGGTHVNNLMWIHDSVHVMLFALNSLAARTGGNSVSIDQFKQLCSRVVETDSKTKQQQHRRQGSAWPFSDN